MSAQGAIARHSGVAARVWWESDVDAPPEPPERRRRTAHAEPVLEAVATGGVEAAHWFVAMRGRVVARERAAELEGATAGRLAGGGATVMGSPT